MSSQKCSSRSRPVSRAGFDRMAPVNSGDSGDSDDESDETHFLLQHEGEDEGKEEDQEDDEEEEEDREEDKEPLTGGCDFKDPDELTALCVNFIRLLTRCHERATKTKSQQTPDQLHSLTMDKYIYVLEDRLSALKEEASKAPLPRPLDLDECKRKLDFVREVLLVVPSGNLNSRTPFNLLEHASSSMSLHEKNAERAGHLSAQAREAQKRRNLLFEVSSVQPFKSPSISSLNSPTDRSGSPLLDLRRRSSELSSADEFWSSDEEPRSAPVSPGSFSPGIQALTGARFDGADKSSSNTRGNVRTAVERERQQHESMREAMVEVTSALKNSVQRTQEMLRAEAGLLDDVHRTGADNLGEISRQDRDLRQHMAKSARWACGTYCLLMLVAFTFVFTYFVIKLFPKAY